MDLKPRSLFSRRGAEVLAQVSQWRADRGPNTQGALPRVGFADQIQVQPCWLAFNFAGSNLRLSCSKCCVIKEQTEFLRCRLKLNRKEYDTVI